MLIMVTVFSNPLYKSGISTLSQVFAREYGDKSATAATLLTSIGSFLSIVSQVLSSIALITAVSHFGSGAATAVVVLMMAYVIFDGV